MPRKAKTYLLLVGGAFLLLIGITAWTAFGPPRSVAISPETTDLTAPLDEAERVDYVAAVVAARQAGITPERNGAIPLLRAAWPGELKPEDQTFVCRELGIEPPDRLGLNEAINGDQWKQRVLAWAQKKWGVDLSDRAQYDINPTYLLNDVVVKPWKRADYPPLAQWADEQTESFAILHQMEGRDQFYFPDPKLAEKDAQLTDDQNPATQMRRIAARCLLARAMMYVGEGEPDLAWRDLRLTFLLSRVSQPQISYSDILLNYALAQVAVNGVEQLLNSGRCDADLLAEISQFLANLPPIDPIGPAIDQVVRWTMLEHAVKSTDSKELFGGTDRNSGYTPLLELPRDPNAMLQRLNQRFDQIVALTKIDDPIQFDTAVAQFLQQTEADFQAWNDNDSIAATKLSQSVRGVYAADVIFRRHGSGLPGAKRVSFRQRAREQLLRVAVELERYRSTNGEYPDSFDALALQLAPELLPDRYSAGMQLCYERRADGGYLLYSRFENGADDHGTSERGEIDQGDWAPTDPFRRSFPTDFDLVLRFPLPPPPQIEKPQSAADRTAD